MTTARKRAAVGRLQSRYPRSSERLRCRVVGLSRSTLRYRARRRDRDAALRAELEALARQTEVVKKWLGDKDPRRVLVVPGRLVNFVA